MPTLALIHAAHSPFLLIGGVYTLSLAGLVLPAGLALILWCLTGHHRVQGAGWIVLAGLLINGALLLHQRSGGFSCGGVHGFNVVAVALLGDFLLALACRRPPRWLLAWRDGAGMVALSFVALLLPDLPSGVVLHAALCPAAPVWLGLGWVGGAGWQDGLLIALPVTAAVWLTLAAIWRVLSPPSRMPCSVRTFTISPLTEHGAALL